MIEPETLTFDRVLVWDETRREWTYVRGDLLDALTEDAATDDRRAWLIARFGL